VTVAASVYFNILQNPGAHGRDYVIYSTDEFFSMTQELHNDAPSHVIGLLTETVKNVKPGKLGFDHHWKEHTTDWNEGLPTNWEYYDYSTELGKLEIENRTESPGGIESKEFPCRYT